VSDLTAQEKRKIERAFGMGSGYVLNFSNRTFSEFFEDNFGLNIYDEKYNAGSGSKANRMRAFWETESNHLVGRALAALVDGWRKFRNPDSPRDPPDDLVRIVERLKSGASVLLDQVNVCTKKCITSRSRPLVLLAGQPSPALLRSIAPVQSAP